MLTSFQHHYRSLMGCLSALMISGACLGTAHAKPSVANVLSQLPTPEQTTLAAGNVVLTGSQGHYIGRVLVTAPLATTWNVLTDYDHFQRFLPGVVSSRILATQGNQVVFEQTNAVRVLLFQRTSHLVITAVKQYPKQISFHLKEGEIKALDGVWQVEPVSAHQILVTQDVNFDPGNSVTRSLAFTIYKNTLANSLKAIQQEAERRAAP